MIWLLVGVVLGAALDEGIRWAIKNIRVSEVKPAAKPPAAPK